MAGRRGSPCGRLPRMFLAGLQTTLPSLVRAQCEDYSPDAQMPVAMAAGCSPGVPELPLSCCRVMYDHSIEPCFNAVLPGYSLEAVIRDILDTCGIELNGGYTGPKPDWYYADDEGYDPSAPAYSEGTEAFFEGLESVTCKHGHDSPYKDFWDSKFFLHDTYVTTGCEGSEKDGEPISIYTQIFVPKTGDVEAVLFVSHGRNEYTDRYHYLFEAGVLDERNFMVVLMDTRGQGTSTGFWNYFPSFKAAACDAGKVMDAVASGLNDIPKFWFCHSTGCAIMLGAISNPEVLPLEIDSYLMSSPFFESFATAEVQCPTVESTISDRTVFGYLQGWQHEHQYREQDSCDVLEPNLHDNKAFFDAQYEDIEIQKCFEKGPATLGFFAASCELNGDPFDPDDGVTGVDFAADVDLTVRIWGSEIDATINPPVTKRWCAAAPDCVYREFAGLCQHELMYSLAAGSTLRDEMYEFMDSRVASYRKYGTDVAVDVSAAPMASVTIMLKEDDFSAATEDDFSAATPFGVSFFNEIAAACIVCAYFMWLR